MKKTILIILTIIFLQSIVFSQLTPVEKDGKFGYVDKQGNLVIDYKYDEARVFDRHGLAKVIMVNRYYLIDSIGTEYLLADNNIDSLSEETRALDLSSSHLIEIPEEVFMFPNLQILLLNNANMHAITVLGGINVLPKEIGNLTNLIVLDLRLNSINKLPPEIGKLKNLRLLDLGGNKLDSLPNEIINLINLRKLHLGGSPLKNLPEEIRKLIKLEKLNLLDIQGCQITELPLEISKLKNLKELRIMCNILSNDEKQKIKKLLPNCKIYF